MPPVQSQGRSQEFESNAPTLRWSRVLCLAIGLFAGSVGGLEGYWRERGVRPHVAESRDLWSFWRRQVYEPSGRVLVFLGTSRVRADVDLETLSYAAPRFRSVQLGVSGDGSPLGTLQSLAFDEKFRGTVICELASPFLPRSRWDDQRKYFGQTKENPSVEQLIAAYIRDDVALLNPSVTISALLRNPSSAKSSVEPSRCQSCFNRSLRYFEEVLPPRIYLPQEQTVDGRTILEGIGAVRPLVHKIHTRGGSVVFVGLPLSAADAETRSGFVGKLTWAMIADLTGAVCIPLETGDSLDAFHCADGAHLDYQQAKRFTRRLVAEMERRHVLK
jgi:hypothetical protein